MIIFLGITGSGKTLQGRLLAKECGYTWISSGEILRNLLTGQKCQEMIAGKLHDDSEMIEVISKEFERINPKQKIILEGFPRTIVQADWLIKRIKAGDFELTKIFNFEVSQTITHDRLIKRRRIDDTESAIQKRFEEYNSATLPIIEHFRKAGYKVIDINATDTPEAIHKNIVSIIDQASKKP